MKAVGGHSEGCSARIEVFINGVAKSGATKELIIWKIILFTEVKYVSCTKKQQKDIITIRMKGDSNSFFFYADTDRSTIKWHMYCSLLLAIPNYTIPEIPKDYDAELQRGIDRNEAQKSDAGTVYISHAKAIICYCLHCTSFIRIHAMYIIQTI